MKTWIKYVEICQNNQINAPNKLKKKKQFYRHKF